MSKRHDVQEETLRNWANLGYITSAKINNQLFLDDESLVAYLEAHKRLGVQEGYLTKIVEEKKLERDFVISKYDDQLYVLKTQKVCGPLYEVVIRELSGLIAHPEHRDIFYSISKGEPIERVAGRHRITYDRALRVYESLLKGLQKKRNILSSYRKLAMDYRFKCLADDSCREQSNIQSNIQSKILSKIQGKMQGKVRSKVQGKVQSKEENILELPIHRVANARLANILQLRGISTVGQLLESMSDKEWSSLLEIKNVGRTSYFSLLFNLRQIGVVDRRLDEILSLSSKK